MLLLAGTPGSTYLCGACLAPTAVYCQLLLAPSAPHSGVVATSGRACIMLCLAVGVGFV